MGKRPALILGTAVVLTQLFGPFARYGPTGYLDTWIYTSYFTDWPDMIRRYGHLYYGTRVPYIAVGALFYKLFSPAVANFLLNALIIFTMCYSVHQVLRRFFRPSASLLYALALAVNVALVQSAVWDYPDGPAMAYGFLGLWFCIAPPAWAAGLLGPLIGGMFYACSGHTLMIMGLIIVPALAAQVLLAWSKGLKEVVFQLGAILAGSIAATVLLGLVHRLAGGSFLFFMPQITQAMWTLSQRNYSRWEQPISSWLPTAYRLLTPAVALTLAIIRLALSTRLRSSAYQVVRALTLFVVFSCALFSYFGFVKNALVLQVSYASVFLLVPSLLFIGFLFGECWEGISAGDARRLTTLAAVALVAVFASYPHIYKSHATISLGVVASAASVPLLAAIRWPAWYMRAGLMFSLLAVSVFPLLADPSINGPAFEADPKGFEIGLHVRQLITYSASQNKLVRFWFAKDENNSALYDSMASLYLWGSPGETEALLRAAQERHDYSFAKNTVFVMLSSTAKRIADDEALLSQYGYQPERQALVRVVKGRYDFYVGLVTTP